MTDAWGATRADGQMAPSERETGRDHREHSGTPGITGVVGAGGSRRDSPQVDGPEHAVDVEQDGTEQVGQVGGAEQRKGDHGEVGEHGHPLEDRSKVAADMVREHRR